MTRRSGRYGNRRGGGRGGTGRRRQPQVSVGVIRIARKGYGFVDTPEGEYFVSRGHLRGAMDGDRVEVVRLWALEARRRRELEATEAPHARRAATGEPGMRGSVRRVLERAHETLVGTLHFANGIGVVRPLDVRIPYDIFLDHRLIDARKAIDGAVVVVRVTTYPSRLEAAQGVLLELIGQEDDRGMGIEIIIREHGFETVFSAAALEEAERLASGAMRDAEGESKRRDLRGRFIFTIDPEDAKDFDDALSVDFIDGRMLLGVHIADVSACVAWDSALDLSARRRATSVYLPDRVIPMLPPSLSEHICSLRPDEDRLTFTVDMLMNTDGSVADCAFYPSLIRSSLRLSYEEAQRLLDASEEDAPGSSLANRLQALRRLSRKLTRRRIQRGAIEFTSVEAKPVLDGEGVPIEVRLREKTDATSIIEEAMILANEQVAAYLLASDAPMVYRIHEEPFAEALDELLPTLQEFGYAQQQAPQCSHEIQAILDASAGRPEHQLLSTLLLRAMKRARYAPSCAPHFGLASNAYTHFTSPIRRYPDLMVHRLLKARLFDEPLPEGMARQLEWICEHSSTRERDAEQAAREATALKLCEYLEPRVGERFSASIIAVSAAGIAVREETTTAEGFVDVDDLDAGLGYDRERHRYHDPGTGVTLRLGQPVEVVLKAVDYSRIRLRFTLA